MKEKTPYSSLERLYTSAPYIGRMNNNKCQIRAALVIGIGILLMVLPTLIHLTSDFVAIVMLTLGLFLLLGALTQYLKCTHQYVYLPTGKRLIMGTSTYDHSCCPMLRSIIEDGARDDYHEVMHANPNGGIRIDYLYSEDHSMLALDARRFENLMWIPFSSKVFLYTGEEAKRAIHTLDIGS